MNYILLAIPFFFILIGVEYVLGLIERKKIYRFNDSVNDLSMGIIDQVGSAFLATIMFAGYLYIWDNWRLFDMGVYAMWGLAGAAVWVWVACFLAKDFMYYWAHRMSHEMNIGWATHIAHHQSEEYNLSVALRQGVFQGFFFNFFYLPLALVGFPPMVYILCSQLNTIYQFWIHTRTIGKLGPLEWVLNTPSHHRVHHGRDPKYIDRNHAGVLIIWDRMFGTFQEEEEEPNYGLVSPLQSWNPVWGQVHYLVRLGKMAKDAPKWSDKLKVWYKPPAWRPDGMPAPEKSSQELWEEGKLQKYDTHIPLGLSLYTLFQFVPALLLAIGFLRSAGDMEWLQRAGAAAMIFWALLNFGGIFELRKWVLPSEIARLVVLSATLVAFGGGFYGVPEASGLSVQIGVLIGGAIALVWFTAYHKQFQVPLWRNPVAEIAVAASETTEPDPETQEA